jgi:hypothetical protein
MKIFIFLVAGDSISWGEGLDESQKHHTMVHDWLKRNIPIPVYKVVVAHCGADLGWDKPVESDVQTVHPEVPNSIPTVREQLELWAGPKSDVYFLLMCGCINDVSVNKILNPYAGSIASDTYKYCRQHMRSLVEHIMRSNDWNPNMKIIVTGYFQIMNGLPGTFFDIIASIFGLPLIAKDLLVSRSIEWQELSYPQLYFAVTDFPDRVKFVDPAFTPENAVGGGDPYLWENSFGPDDTTRSLRERECVIAHRNDDRCKMASIGHPNVKGAQQYANRIIDVLPGFLI